MLLVIIHCTQLQGGKQVTLLFLSVYLLRHGAVVSSPANPVAREQLALPSLNLLVAPVVSRSLCFWNLLRYAMVLTPR